jgi:hypothetical protein
VRVCINHTDMYEGHLQVLIKVLQNVSSMNMYEADASAFFWNVGGLHLMLINILTLHMVYEKTSSEVDMHYSYLGSRCREKVTTIASITMEAPRYQRSNII